MNWQPLYQPEVVLAEPSTIGIIITGIVISAGVSLLAAKLSKKRGRNTIEDSKPTVLADRGAFVPWLGAGRRRVGYVFAWAGNRFTRDEKVSGGKGGAVDNIVGGKQKVPIFYEDGWHILCIGPVVRLWNIKAAGQTLFFGPISRDSHPSGSVVDLGKWGSFAIYWGEKTQPINTSLGDSSRVGISSRWPGATYIEWFERRLGQTAIWDFMDYEVEGDFGGEATLPSEPKDEPTRSLYDNPFSLPQFGPHTVITATDGGPGVAKIKVAGITTAFYGFQSTHLRLTGNTADGDYEILSSATVDFGVNTEFTLNDTLSGSNSAGQTFPLQEQEDDGYNPIHVIYKMLFFKFPYGLGLPVDQFDIPELDALALQIRAEGITSSIIAVEGETARGSLGKIMMDLGLFMHWDSVLGRFVIEAFRERSTVQRIPEDMVIAPKPERTKLAGPKRRDKLVFKFLDRERAFRDNTIDLDADEDGAFTGRQKPTEIELASVTNYTSAVVVSERRSQEEFARPQAVNVNANRGARLLNPGEKIALGPDYTEELRILGKKLQHLTGKLVLICVNDFYGYPDPTFTNQQGGGLDTGLLPVQADIVFDFFEVPSFLTSIQVIIVPRVRAHTQITQAGINISPNDVTYTLIDTETSLQTGGTLNEELASTSTQLIATGPEFDVQGFDTSVFQDLTGDDANWRLGRQWVVIGEEIMFVQKITAISGSTYRLDGIHRARYDTPIATHSIGAQLFIFNPSNILGINDALLSFNALIYVKTQPEAGESISLAEVTPVSKTLLGKGIAPMLPGNLRTVRVRNRPNAYLAGGDVVFNWVYRSNEVTGSGAGLQNAGTPTGNSAIQGDFTLVITDLADVVIRSVPSIAALTYTYTNADMVSDFAGEPTSFKAKLRNVNGGFTSPVIEITVTKVAP